MAAPLHLNIPEPCHENWQQMTPNEQGRHCMACQKTVVDFTLLSDQEILDHISRASSSVCGRFNKDQLDKVYVQKKPKPHFTFRYAWNMITAAFLLTGSTTLAQSRKNTIGKAKTDQPARIIDRSEDIFAGAVISEQVTVQRKITGQVIDENTGLPVSFAYVRIKGVKSGIAAGEDGYFEIAPPAKRDTLTLVVSAIGYTDNEFDVPLKDGKTYKVMLAQEAEELKPVVVTAMTMGIIARREAPPLQECSAPDSSAWFETIAGGLSVTYKVTKVEKLKRTINDWLTIKKDLHVYPNPVMPGNSITVVLNFGKTGDYKMEFMDAGGRIVWVRATQVVQQSQVVNIPTASSWSRGLYWIRISSAKDKKVYQAKVLLQ